MGGRGRANIFSARYGRASRVDRVQTLAGVGGVEMPVIIESVPVGLA